MININITRKKNTEIVNIEVTDYWHVYGHVNSCTFVIHLKIKLELKKINKKSVILTDF